MSCKFPADMLQASFNITTDKCMEYSKSDMQIIIFWSHYREITWFINEAT